MANERFQDMLSGGHPNSLGRTVEVVDCVLNDRDKLEELYNCYFCNDEVVRLRTSNAIKRISREKPNWLVPYLNGLLNEVAQIDQASTQWTLATLFETLSSDMSSQQLLKAKQILKTNLESQHDWIVLNTTMQTLEGWASTDLRLRDWLVPQLTRLSSDKRKSVSGRAKKLLARLG